MLALRRLLLPVVVLALTGVTTLSSADAAPAPPTGHAAITRPTAGAVVLGGAVPVEIRVGAGTRSFTVRLGTTVVRSAFRRTGTARTATLRVGTTRGLRYGPNTLRVRTTDAKGRRHYTERAFVLARPVAGLVGRASAGPSAQGGARLTLRLARAGLAVTVVAGGRRTAFGRAGRTVTLHLSADEGVRPGRNRVRVRVLDRARGRYQETAVRLRMPAHQPVAGAGRFQRVHVGRPTRLDASRSVAAAGAGALRYHWALVGAPKGARPQLHVSTSRRPTVILPRPGRYRYRVTVRQAGGTRPAAFAGRAHTARSVASDADIVTLDSAIVVPGIGAPLDTIATQGKQTGVLLQSPYGTSGGGFVPAPTAAGTIQVVLIARSTGVIGTSTSFLNDENGSGQLLAYLTSGSVDQDDLVVVSKPNAASAPGADVKAATNIDKALAAIGVDPVGAAVSTGSTPCTSTGIGQCSVFSALGVPGSPLGQGRLNPGLNGVAKAGVATGDLHGFLQEHSTGSGDKFAFASVERVPFDTGASNANPAVITIGSGETGSPVPLAHYTSSTLSTPGWYVLVLDAGTLTKRADGTYSATQAGLAPMVSLLKSYEHDRSALVLVRSIGNVRRVSSGGGSSGNWDSVANALRVLGGSYFTAQALDGSNSNQYAQVGPANVDGKGGTPAFPDRWTQIGNVQRTGSGRVTGLLARDSAAQWYPAESVAPDVMAQGQPLASTLTGLISLPLTPWPDRDTVGEQNLARCIATYVDPGGSHLAYPIESNYTDPVAASDLGTWAAYIKPADYATWAANANCKPFTQSDYDQLAPELQAEWSNVASVNSLRSSLTSTLVTGSGAALGQIRDTTSAIDEDTGTSDTTVTYDGAGIASDLLWAVSAIPGVGDLADLMNLVAAGLGVADELGVGADGSSPAVDLTATGAALGNAVFESYQTQMAALDAEVSALTSDPDKLQLAAANILNATNQTADWSPPAQGDVAAVNQLVVAARRQAYLALFPAVYATYRISAGDWSGSLDPNDVTTYPCSILANGYLSDPTYPFAKVPRYGGVETTVTGEASFEQWVYATPDSGFVNDEVHGGVFPGESLLQAMFTNPGDGIQDGPLFDPLAFAVDAYGDAGQNTIGVTHQWMPYGIDGQTNRVCSVKNLN